MLLDLVVFVVGLVGLYYGAEWLIEGASKLALSLGVSSLVIGLTLVSIGTSAPELVVSGIASMRGNGGLAIGNVLGSNVANIGLILGLSAMILPLPAERDVLKRDLPVMVAAAALFPLLGLGGMISRGEGAVLLIAFCAYLAYLARAAKTQSAEATAEKALADVGSKPPPMNRAAVWKILGVSFFGLIVLVVGANLLVGSAVDIATALGVPDLVIGLTLVALGTSLPELAASISAARRGDGQIILGNIIGSNIFNILLILGVAAIVNPLPVSSTALRMDAPFVMGVSILLMAIVVLRRKVGRAAGGVLLATYAGFILLAAL